MAMSSSQIGNFSCFLGWIVDKMKSSYLIQFCMDGFILTWSNEWPSQSYKFRLAHQFHNERVTFLMTSVSIHIWARHPKLFWISGPSSLFFELFFLILYQWPIFFKKCYKLIIMRQFLFFNILSRNLTDHSLK